jgi:biopolymer transport protein ExbB
MINFLLQVPADSAGLNITGSNSLDNLLDLTLKGGPIMIPIGILSIIGVYLLIERYLSIKKAGKTDPLFMKRIKDMVMDGNIKGASSLCETSDTPVARMLEKGLSRIGKPLKDIHVAVENTGRLEVYKLEKGMPIMATIAGAAPMLGFLGTVTGMINTFKALSEQADTIDAGLLSGGIYEAMVTTVAGLVVGIFAYIAYNLLTAMIEKVINKMEAHTVEFLDILHEPS